MPNDALVFCMPPAGSLPTAANPGRVNGIGHAKHSALPGEEYSVKIVLIARLTANEKNPKISRCLIYVRHLQVL